MNRAYEEIVSEYGPHSYLTESVDDVALQKSIPAEICQLIFHMSIMKGQVARSVRELASAKRL